MNPAQEGKSFDAWYTGPEDARHWAYMAWQARATAAHYKFAGWFVEVPSGMSYRLWEQGGRGQSPGEVALYDA